MTLQSKLKNVECDNVAGGYTYTAVCGIELEIEGEVLANECVGASL